MEVVCYRFRKKKYVRSWLQIEYDGFSCSFLVIYSQGLYWILLLIFLVCPLGGGTLVAQNKAKSRSVYG